MAGTEYTLSGLDALPACQRVVFVEPLPSTRICGVCGVVPSRSFLLPCGHVLCLVCKGQVLKEDAKCPFDEKVFADADAVPLTFEQSQLEQCRLFCVAGGGGCTFAGKLCDLKGQLTGCGSIKVKCAKCQQSVVRSVAVEHYRQCSTETPPQHTVTAISNAVVRLGDMKKDLESVRKQASSENVDKTAIVNGVNSLMECLTSIERDLIRTKEEADGEQCASSQSGAKKMVFPPGPYRAASKLGAFVTTCEFSNVYKGYKALRDSVKEHRLSTSVYTLAGYTFKLDCKLQKGDEHVTVSFVLFLKEGAWDGWVEWPFAKKVTMIITHPRDEAKDIRLPMVMEDPKMVKKPFESSNWGKWTEAKNWVDLEMQGFFNNNSLYVNVGFE